MEAPTSIAHWTCSCTTAENIFSLATPLSHTPVSSCTRSHTAQSVTPTYASSCRYPSAFITHWASLACTINRAAHQSSMKTRATSLNGANCKPTPPSPPPGIPPVQTNWGAYAKASAPGPARARASKAPTPSFPFPMTRSQPTAAGKSPTPRLFARSNRRRETTPTARASPSATTTLHILEM